MQNREIVRLRAAAERVGSTYRAKVRESLNHASSINGKDLELPREVRP